MKAGDSDERPISVAIDPNDHIPYADESKAFNIGYADGLAWDLDDFPTHARVLADTHGWDEQASNAMGEVAFAKHIGVDVGPFGNDGESVWLAASNDYNRGAHAGACAPQCTRTGLPPRGDPVPPQPRALTSQDLQAAIEKACEPRSTVPDLVGGTDTARAHEAVVALATMLARIGDVLSVGGCDCDCDDECTRYPSEHHAEHECIGCRVGRELPNARVLFRVSR